MTGGLLLIIGFLMWFLSGVGLLVLLIGLVLSGIPGKRGMIVQFLEIANIRHVINNYCGGQRMAPFKFED